MLLTSCGQETWYRTPSGLSYRVIVSEINTGPVSETGCTVKFRVGKETVPRYQFIIPGVTMPYSPEEVFAYGQHEGDSILVSQRLDSMVKKGLIGKYPAGKSGSEEVLTSIKVLRVFPAGADSLLKLDKKTDEAAMDSLQRILGPQRLTAYIHKKNIKAFEIAGGAWIETIARGNGPLAGTDSILVSIKLEYPNGTMLMQRDSIPYRPGKKGLPSTVDSLLKIQTIGSQIRIYLPTMLAFGGHPPAASIPAYADVVFEVEILEKSR
jgi:hypothetical protein